VCGELRKRGIVAHERPARLTPTGREHFGDGTLRLPGVSSTGCDGRGAALPAELAAAVRDVARLARAAPSPRVELDQCHCTVETKLRRVLALHEADALVGRRILVLGDDDLVSLAIASVVRRFGSARTIANLTVVDIDPAVVRFLRKGLARAYFPASCLRHDLRDPLPPVLCGAFDTVVTDPPYTVAGGKLFLSRAADALREGGKVFLSFGATRAEVAFSVQRELTAMGLAIEALVPDFNRYVGAGVLGGTSHLYRLRASGSLRPLVSGRFEGPLYTAESR
jgi:predicted methyltransferase